MGPTKQVRSRIIKPIYKWPYSWVAGVITLLTGIITVITLLITGDAALHMWGILQSAMLVVNLVFFGSVCP